MSCGGEQPRISDSHKKCYILMIKSHWPYKMKIWSDSGFK